MKKTLIILLFVLIIGLTATIAYGQTLKLVDEKFEFRPERTAEHDEWKEWHNERLDWKRSQIDQAIEKEEITEEQANTWKEHFDYMEKFHRENGPMPGCYGAGYRWNGRGFRHGHGPGRMWR
ncbi:MAG TPA: hypothetical protein GXX70_03810 [Tepidimicrobium sp.]|nr:hypothetical protein [Tepidimicrobium sp.]